MISSKDGSLWKARAVFCLSPIVIQSMAKLVDTHFLSCYTDFDFQKGIGNKTQSPSKNTSITAVFMQGWKDFIQLSLKNQNDTQYSIFLEGKWR